MPAPLGVASSLFLYGVIPCVPFIGYSVAVPTVLSLYPPPDECTPNLRLYLLVSYALAYLFLLHSFSIVLWPLPGLSCFHRLDVKLLSLASLSALQLASLAHAVLFLLLPAYLPDALSSLLSSASSSSSYLPLPVSSDCTASPTFVTSLAGVGVQSFFLLWLLCTAAVAWCEEHCWQGWTAQELQAIEEAKARHAQWTAERDDERRKLIDGKAYRPANAVAQQRAEKQTGVQAGTVTAPSRQSSSSTGKDAEEQKEQEEEESGDEEEIVRYTDNKAAVRRREREREEQKEQSDTSEDGSEEDEEDEEEEDDDEGDESEPSDEDEPRSASLSLDAAASEREDEEDGAVEKQVAEQEQEIDEEREKDDTEQDSHSSDESAPNEQGTEDSSQTNDNDGQADEEADAKAAEASEADNNDTAYSERYGALTAHAHSRSAAAPSLPVVKPAAHSSAAPLSTPPLKSDVPQPATPNEASSDATRRVNPSMSRTAAVRQAADIFGTVPIAMPIYPSTALSNTTLLAPHAAELPPLPPMSAFAATAPITIPAPSFSSAPPPIRPSAAATQTLFSQPSATSSYRHPPLPIVALPLRRPQLTPLSLKPPLSAAGAVSGRLTASSSPPLPIGPIPLSPKAFFSTVNLSTTHSPPPGASTLHSPLLAQPNPLASTTSASCNAPPLPVVGLTTACSSSVPTPAASYSTPPLPVTAHLTAVSVSPPPMSSVDSSVAQQPEPFPMATEAESQQRQPPAAAQSEREVQLVAELRDVQQQRQQQLQRSGREDWHIQPLKKEPPSAVRSSAAAEQLGQEHVDVPEQPPQQEHYPRRLSDAGQFVVETSDGSSGAIEGEAAMHTAVTQPAEEDEISFSDDEDGADRETARAETAGQLLEADGAAVNEQSVVLEEEVEEEVF